MKVLVPRARQGRPRLDRKLAPVDVLWLPAPAPVAISSDTPYVLTVHDLSFLERREDFTRYERLWHRLARIDALVHGAAAVVALTGDTARRAAAHFRRQRQRRIWRTRRCGRSPRPRGAR